MRETSYKEYKSRKTRLEAFSSVGVIRISPSVSTDNAHLTHIISQDSKQTNSNYKLPKTGRTTKRLRTISEMHPNNDRTRQMSTLITVKYNARQDLQ